jgi:hypothetical protein
MMLRATVLFCLALGGCAGPRHLSPRTGEAFAAVVDRQTRGEDEALPIEITGEDGPGILAGVHGGRDGEAGGGQPSGGAPLMPLAR